MRRNPPPPIPGGDPPLARALSFDGSRLGRATARHARPVWIFLARGCFALKTQIQEVVFPWISLDSLVRIETYQWVTRDFRRKIFRGPFAPLAFEAAGWKTASAAMRKCRRLHRASVTWILIFCKGLSALMALAVGPRATAQPQRHGRACRGHPRPPALSRWPVFLESSQSLTIAPPRRAAAEDESAVRATLRDP
jgi:hypothetical protein